MKKRSLHSQYGLEEQLQKPITLLGLVNIGLVLLLLSIMTFGHDFGTPTALLDLEGICVALLISHMLQR